MQNYLIDMRTSLIDLINMRASLIDLINMPTSLICKLFSLDSLTSRSRDVNKHGGWGQ